MTILNETNKVIALGTGATNTFSFSPMQIRATDQVEVFTIDVNGVATQRYEGVSTTNYSITLTGDVPSTGFVKYPATGVSYLASGEKIVIRRRPPLTQDTNLDNQGGYFPEVQEAQFDLLAMGTLYVKEAVDRAVKLPVDGPGNIDVTLPAPLAGSAIGWNQDGNALVNLDDDGTTGPVTPVISGVLNIDDGTLDAPAYSFANQTDTGWWWDETNNTLEGSNKGVRGIRITADGDVHLSPTGASKFPVLTVDGDGTQTKRVRVIGSTTKPTILAEGASAGNTSLLISAEGEGTIDFYGVTPFGIQVTQHGVAHTVATDQSTAIETIANTISAAGGGTLIFPPGDYYILRRCNIPSNIKLKGEGKVRIMRGKYGTLGTAGTFLFDNSSAAVQLNSTTSSGGTTWIINTGVTGGSISRFGVGGKWRIQGAGGSNIAVRDEQDLTVTANNGVNQFTTAQTANADYLASWSTGTYPDAAAYVALNGGTDFTLLSPYVQLAISADVSKGAQYVTVSTSLATNYVVGEVYALQDDLEQINVAGTSHEKGNVEFVRITVKTDLGGGSTKLEFSSPLKRAYTTARHASLYRVTWVENVVFENLDIVSYEAPNATPSAKVPCVDLYCCKNSYGRNLRFNGRDADQAGVRGSPFRLSYAWHSWYETSQASDTLQSGTGDGKLFEQKYTTGGGFRDCYADGGRYNFSGHCITEFEWHDLISKNALVADYNFIGAKEVGGTLSNVQAYQGELRSSASNTTVAAIELGNTGSALGVQDINITGVNIYSTGSPGNRGIDLLPPFSNINITGVKMSKPYDGFFTRSNLDVSLVGTGLRISDVLITDLVNTAFIADGDADAFVGYQLADINIDGLTVRGSNKIINASQVASFRTNNIDVTGNGSAVTDISFVFADITNLDQRDTTIRSAYSGWDLTICPYATIENGSFEGLSTAALLTDNGDNDYMDFCIGVKDGSNPHIVDANDGPSTGRTINIPGRQRGKVVSSATYDFIREDLGNAVIVDMSAGSGNIVLTVPLTILRSIEIAEVSSETTREIGIIDVINIGSDLVEFDSAANVTLVLPSGFTTLAQGEEATLNIVRTGSGSLSIYVTVGGASGGGSVPSGTSKVIVRNEASNAAAYDIGGQLEFDDGGDILKTTDEVVYSDSSDVSTISANTYTVAATDRHLQAISGALTERYLTVLNATPANTVVITLPKDAAITKEGAVFRFRQATTQSGLVTLVPEAGGLLDDATSAVEFIGPGATVEVIVESNTGSAPIMYTSGGVKKVRTIKGNTTFSDTVTLTTPLATTSGGTEASTAHAGMDNLNVKGADIASASTTDLNTATGNWVDVTGTTGISALGTVTVGVERLVRFTGALVLTHNGTSLILPGSASITTVANDWARFRSLGSGNWICVSYSRSDGGGITAPLPVARGGTAGTTGLTGLAGLGVTIGSILSDASTVTSSTPSNVTNLSTAIGIGTYYIDGTVLFRTSLATGGLIIALTYPANTYSAFEVKIPANADGIGRTFEGRITASGGSVTATSAPTNNVTFVAKIFGVVKTTSSGTFQIQIGSEDNSSTITPKAGSNIIQWAIG